MKLPEFEKALVSVFLNTAHEPPIENFVDPDGLVIKDTEDSILGILHCYEQSDASKLYNNKVDYNWELFDIQLNEKTRVGCIVYVRDGYLDSLEGYSSLEEWPEKIDTFEFL